VNSAYEACTILGDDPTGRHKKMVDKLATYDSTKDPHGRRLGTCAACSSRIRRI
jgi:hypothetical protein